LDEATSKRGAKKGSRACFKHPQEGLTSWEDLSGRESFQSAKKGEVMRGINSKKDY